MTPLRLFAVFLIFILASLAWVVLGTANVVRTQEADRTGTEKVAALFGRSQSQVVPSFTTGAAQGEEGARALEVVSTDATADVRLDPRRKGLLWFATYHVDFQARYGVSNPATAPVTALMSFRFPSPDGVYDGFAVLVDGKEVPVEYGDSAATAHFPIPAGETVTVRTGYRTGGMEEWRYVPSPDGAEVIRDFSLVMTTDFKDVDYADGAVSPTSVDPMGDGMRLTWAYERVVSGRPIALVMPERANPGPLAYRISYFAPVSLLFFFAGLILLTATSHVRLHPMHYGFVAAAFFAFHLLLSYLADQIPMGWAFAIASAASVALVVGYLAVVLRRAGVLVEIAISQVLFLVLFSYSFFFEGLTGLAVTIGSVLTLGYFMAKTAKVDWEQVFRREPRAAAPVPAGVPDGPAFDAAGTGV